MSEMQGRPDAFVYIEYATRLYLGIDAWNKCSERIEWIGVHGAFSLLHQELNSNQHKPTNILSTPPASNSVSNDMYP